MTLLLTNSNFALPINVDEQVGGGVEVVEEKDDVREEVEGGHVETMDQNELVESGHEERQESHDHRHSHRHCDVSELLRPSFVLLLSQQASVLAEFLKASAKSHKNLQPCSVESC